MQHHNAHEPGTRQTTIISGEVLEVAFFTLLTAYNNRMHIIFTFLKLF